MTQEDTASLPHLTIPLVKTCCRPGCYNKITVDHIPGAPDFPVACDNCIRDFDKKHEQDERYVKWGIICEQATANKDFIKDHGYWSFKNRNLDMTHTSWALAKAWSHTKKKNVYIHGPGGVGKTTMARLLLTRHCYNNMCYPVDVTGRQIVRRVGWDDKNIARWGKAGCLLLDDIDKIKWEWARMEILFELINERYTNKLPTIVTSNMSPGDLKRKMAKEAQDDMMVSHTLERLMPMEIIQMEGKSWRNNQ